LGARNDTEFAAFALYLAEARNARFRKRAFMKHRSLLSLSFAIAACAFFAARSQAQQKDPDFSNVNDVLQGNRTLLQITDLQVAGVGTGNAAYLYQATTSDSSVKNNSLITTKLSPGLRRQKLISSSGWMFNQPEALTVTAVNWQGYYYQPVLVQNVRNTEPSFSLSVEPANIAAPVHITGEEMADFNQDGYDDLAISFDYKGSIRILTACDVNNPNNTDGCKGIFGQPSRFRFGPTAFLDPLNDMATGDFNGDGRPEIAGLSIQPNGGLKLVIYTVDPKSLAITPASSLVLDTANAGSPITHVSIARGKFNTLSHDQLVVAFATNSGPSAVKIVDFEPDTLTPTEKSSLVASKVAISSGFIQVKTGKFAFPNPYDQIVWHSASPAASSGRFFEIISVNPTNFALTANAPVGYGQYPCSYGLTVGNFDHQQPDPRNPGKNQHNPNSQIAFMYGACDNGAKAINIYSIDSNSFGLKLESGNPVQLPSDPLNSPPALSLVATDIQGRSVTLGEPTKVVVQDTAQPSMIAAMPPMHVDFIPPVAGQAPTLLNLSAIPDGFRTVYETNETNTGQSSTTNTTSWSFGTQVSLEVGFEIGNVEGGLGLDVSSTTKAAQDNKTTFEEEYGQYRSSKFDASVKTGFADQIWYTDSRFNMYVYPVIGQAACAKPNCIQTEKVPLTIQFSGPDKIESHRVDGNLIPWYQPPWEPGNVFSYPATDEQLKKIVPNIQFLSEAQASRTDTSTATERATWTTETTQGATAAVDQNYSFEQEFSVNGAVSYGIATGRAGLSLNLSGSSGLSNLSKSVTSVGRSAGIGIEKPGTFRDPTRYNYSFTPYIFGETKPDTVVDNEPLDADVTSFGLLRTAFTADPARNDAGGWWKQAYHNAPDVALNHPSRWHWRQVGENASNCLPSSNGMDCFDLAPSRPDNLWESNFHIMRGFFISSAVSAGKGPQLTTATAGDKLALQARIYNYSFAPMPVGTNVHVRFYAQQIDPNNQHKPVGDSILINNADVLLPPIPPFSDDDGAPLNWVLARTNFDTTGFDGKYLIFWVVVWMEDANGKLMPEIEGHGLRSIPGDLKSLADVQADTYSNNVGFYNSAFYVFPAQSLTATTGGDGEPATIEMANGQISAKRVLQGQTVDISAELVAQNNSASGVTALFYDGDPHDGGVVFGLERTPYIAENGTYQVEAPYSAGTCGKHDLFVVVHEGTPDEVLSRVGKLKVDCGHHWLDDRASTAVEEDGRW